MNPYIDLWARIVGRWGEHKVFGLPCARVLVPRYSLSPSNASASDFSAKVRAFGLQP